MAWGALTSLGTSGGSGGGSLFGNLLNNVNIGSYLRRGKAEGRSKKSSFKDWGMSNITGDMFTDREAESRDAQNRQALIEASKSGGTINYYASPSGGSSSDSDSGSDSGGGFDLSSIMNLINMFSNKGRTVSKSENNPGFSVGNLYRG